MCGILGAYSFSGKPCPAFEITIGWSVLRERGDDAAGFAYRALEGEDWCKTWKTKGISYDYADILYNSLRKEKSRWVMTHTRKATKGTENDNKNNHPVQHESVILTHNGVVRNDDDLFKDDWKGVTRQADVDTIAIAAALHIGGIKKVVDKVKGSMSIAWTQISEPDALHLYTNGQSPLYLAVSKDFAIYASTEKFIPKKLLDEAEKVGHVKAGSHVIFTPDTIDIEDVGVGVTTQSTTYGYTGHGNRTAHGFVRHWRGSAKVGEKYYCYDDSCHRIAEANHLHDRPTHNSSDHNHKVVVVVPAQSETNKSGPPLVGSEDYYAGYAGW